MLEGSRIEGKVYVMSDLLLKIQKCEIALDHLEYRFDLNTVHTAESIIRYPLLKLKGRWVKEAEIISRESREASFEELSDYPVRQAKWLEIDSVGYSGTEE